MTTDKRFTRFSLAIAIIALGLAGWATFGPTAKIVGNQVHVADPVGRSPLLKAIASGTINVGYGGYPPYTIEDPNTGKVTGLSVDLVNEISSQLKIKVVWKKFNWSTMSVDLKRGDIDLIADPIFETIPRGLEFSFTEPYAYVPTGIGVIRQGGRHFASFSDLDDPAITVAVGLGLAEETLLRARAPKANVIAVPVGADTTAAANLVLTSRADIAIVTLSDAKRFLAANPGKLEALWMDTPPAYMPAGFAVRLDDELGAAFLNVAIRNLKSTGTIGSLAKRYDIEEDFHVLSGTP